MKYTNEMELIFDSLSQNEGFARVAVAAFMTVLNPTIEEVADVKTAVSEVVTNSILHGYRGEVRKIRIHGGIQGNRLYLKLQDWGKGIADLEKAMEPMFTSRPDLERSGMGFTFMEAFMDELFVQSKVGEGTTVYMTKQIDRGEEP